MATTSAAYVLREPASLESCVVFSSPHSGRDYPAEMVGQSRLSEMQLRQSEDAYVEELFAAAPDFGAPLIAATAARAYLDLNRGPAELDPALIEGVRANGINPRVAAGLGVVPRVVAEGVAIYHGKLSAAEALQRI
ncbi:MAG TPA: N-formylglutamate amidohydrolase, partial [Paracoccaceae bacterium]|nr:N-formylglutamate amidohydrolase [Paracoccaceae bacterium]